MNKIKYFSKKESQSESNIHFQKLISKVQVDNENFKMITRNFFFFLVLQCLELYLGSHSCPVSALPQISHCHIDKMEQFSKNNMYLSTHSN